MSNWKRADVLQVIGRLQRYFANGKLEGYWQGFGAIPFAFYDEQTVFLVNHPSPPEDFQPISGMAQVYQGPWSNQFNANTNINFAGTEIGIFSLDGLDPTISSARIAGLMAHEMFHAYQVINNLINYSELLFFRYHFTKENLAYRVAEREELLRAVYVQDAQKRLEHLRQFIAWREKRRELLGELIEYELGVESMEGSATYVEYQVRKGLSQLPEEFILAQYCQSLAGYPEDLQGFRHSCFPTGLVICLLLDQFRPDWQQEMEVSKRHLYELLREIVTQQITHNLAGVGDERTGLVTDVEVSHGVEEVDVVEGTEEGRKVVGREKTTEPIETIPEQIKITDWARAEVVMARAEEKRQRELAEFWQFSGNRVVIRGQLQVRGFDPMNLTVLDGQLLHRRMLVLHHQSGDLFIQGQSLATFPDDDVMHTSEVIFYVQKPPIEIAGVIKLEGVGEIQGELVQDEQGFLILI